METEYLKQLDDGELADHLEMKKSILELCTEGAMNNENEVRTSGLYWAVDDVLKIADELSERLFKRPADGINKNH